MPQSGSSSNPVFEAATSSLPAVAVQQTLQASAGIVDLWLALPERIVSADVDSVAERLLSSDELARCRRFRRQRDRQLFAASRVLLRQVLSRYAAVAPQDWEFGTDANGRPHVAHPATEAPLHFNLSHCAGLVACAVSTAHPRLGVDAEGLARAADIDIAAIAARHWSGDERQALLALPAVARQHRFIAGWTLKESYFKARGLGLALPLDQAAFLFGDDGIAPHFDARLADDPTRWRFALVEAGPSHLVAIGVDSGGAPLSLRVAQLDAPAAA